MQGTPVAGGHGLKAVGLARGANMNDRSRSGLTHGSGAGGFETFGVKGDKINVLGIEPQHLGGDVFKGVEQFAIAGEEQGSVRTAAFYINLADFNAIGISRTRTGSDAVFKL
jgi:hypothetical protein